MSWTEIGVVIITTPSLVIRTKFGATHKFNGIEGYQEGEKVLLACTPSGKTTIIEEHTVSVPPLIKKPKIPIINYEDLFYIE